MSAALTVPTPTVAILLCVYQGEAFLAQQLDSIASQTHRHWKVYVSDDGSTDRTRAILEDYQSQWGADRLHITDGPQRGFAANFLTLLCRGEVRADFYAYCDHDDLWAPDKLERALRFIAPLPSEKPALYASRTRLIDESGASLGFSPRFMRPPAFANALVQNIGGGNTMLFNEAASRLLKSAGVVDVTAHDWWTYLVVSGCGGAVFYDPNPSMQYRQHAKNQMGTNRGLTARLTRIRMLLDGQFRTWNTRNLTALHALRSQLTPENQKILDTFTAVRSDSLFTRLAALRRSGVYRQTLGGNLGLLVAACGGKL
ncbi:MAG: glycosyltransferase family 2 protein [Proteobacteria bacterium]|nr:glycosyltransferase family 2 protein [Pseudomonadota bacterium]MCL2308584.1 glycosyltransferase family 2 protein [Pseudomonadota bacterium]